MIVSIDNDSPAKGSLEVGDVIQEVNREIVKKFADDETVTSILQKDKTIILMVNRLGTDLFVAVQSKPENISSSEVQGEFQKSIPYSVESRSATPLVKAIRSAIKMKLFH